MESRRKNDILGKTRLIRGLLNILEYDVENIKSDVLEGDRNSIERTIKDANTTLENLIDVMAELEYHLYLNGYTRE